MSNFREVNIVDPDAPTNKLGVTPKKRIINEAMPTVLALVQEGKFFSFGSSLAIGLGLRSVAFTTPSDKFLMTLIIESVDVASVKFFEGTAYAVGTGTAQTVLNHDFALPNTSGFSPEVNPTGIVTGTKLSDYQFGGNLRGSLSIGGSRDMDIPFVLKVSQRYILEVDDLASNAANVSSYTFQLVKSEDFNTRT